MLVAVEIDWINQTHAQIEQQAITDHLTKILRRLGAAVTVGIGPVAIGQLPRRKTLAIEIIVVGEKEITRLNRQHLNQNQPTDILSFPQTPGLSMLGSLVICFPIAAEQARQAGISLTEELKTLISHGFLHLLGYHHR